MSYDGTTEDGRAKWLCKCECGNRTTVLASSLKTGNTISCGCVLKSKITSHGKSHTKLYQVWLSMKTRCDNPRSNRYAYYGGKGITYDIKWKTFENFYSDMSDTYKENLTLDRIDNNRGYYKENCEWVDYQIQNNNKSDNIIMNHGNAQFTVKEISQLTGLLPTTIYNRRRIGWTDEEIIQTPVNTEFINTKYIH